MDTTQDDGSLLFLKIEPDKNNRHFNCPETTQQKLINLSFWIIDYLEDVKTKFGSNRFLVKIKYNKEDSDTEAKKFFTNSGEIKDNRLLSLLDEIIDSADGVPIGNYLSQYFANLYLTYFDHWLKEKKGVQYYFRYADDIVVLHHDKKYLHDIFRKMQAYLAENLKLQIKSNWQIFPVAARGIDFVGYVFYHTHTRLRKSIKKRFCRRLARINRRKVLTEADFKQSICPWWGWAKYCNSINLINKLSKNSKYEIKFRR